MKDWKKMRAVVTICAALGWWGIWFPELAVWTEVVCVVEDGQQGKSVQMEENVVECEDVRRICEGLLKADKEQIRLKSRLLVLIERYLQKN